MKDYRDVIIRPIVTEKSMKLNQELNKVTFEVPKKVNKIEIREAVEHLFGVKVEKVNIINTKPKMKRVGRYMTKVSGIKKAIVTLADGESIDIFGEDAE